MSNKKLMTEGKFVEKIFGLLKMGKYRQVQSKLKSDKKVQKAIEKFEKSRIEMENAVKHARNLRNKL